MTKTETKVLLLSAASAAVAILMLGYSAFGWITMSREIKATGMNLTVFMPDGLEISDEENGVYSNTVTVKLKQQVAQLTASDDKKFNVDEDEFFLLPASSYAGLSVWETGAAAGNGQALCNADEFNSGHTISYNTDSDMFEGHYIDAQLWLRSPSLSGMVIKLSKNNTVVTSSDSETVMNVVRVAFLNQSADGISYTENAGYDALVYADPNYSNTTGNVVTESAVPGISDFIAPKYITFGDTVSNQIITTIPAPDAEESYAKTCITVRIWIEGQDNACVSNIGGKSFNVQLGFTAENI